MSTDLEIKNAALMANKVTGMTEHSDTGYKWTRAFMAAMNWTRYQDGKRQLTGYEMREAVELYGEVSHAAHI